MKWGVEVFMETGLLGQDPVKALRNRGASVMSPYSSIEEIGIELGNGLVWKVKRHTTTVRIVTKGERVRELDPGKSQN